MKHKSGRGVSFPIGFFKRSHDKVCRKLQSFHQAVHSSDADDNAIVTLKYIGDFIDAKPFVITSVNLQNKSCDFLVFFGAISWLCGEVFTIRASVNTKNFAKKFLSC